MRLWASDTCRRGACIVSQGPFDSHLIGSSCRRAPYMMIKLLQSHDGRHSYKLALMRLALDRALNLTHSPFYRMIDTHASGPRKVGFADHPQFSTRPMAAGAAAADHASPHEMRNLAWQCHQRHMASVHRTRTSVERLGQSEYLLTPSVPCFSGRSK